MTKLITGLLLIFGLAAPAAAQRFGPIPDPTASGRQWMREQQAQQDRWNAHFQAQQQAHELQMLRLEIERQGRFQREQEQRRQLRDTDFWR